MVFRDLLFNLQVVLFNGSRYHKSFLIQDSQVVITGGILLEFPSQLIARAEYSSFFLLGSL